MADTKITDLTALAVAPADEDLFVAVDVSDTTMAATGTDKKIAWSTIVAAIEGLIDAPTISDFTSAGHDHADAAGGGTLDAAAIGSGVFSTARLGSGTPSANTALMGNGAWNASPSFTVVTGATMNASGTFHIAGGDSIYADAHVMYHKNSYIHAWSSGGAGSVGPFDLGYGRNAAGMFEINSSVAGQFRDIVTRLYRAATVSPSQITGDQNDYAPTRGGFQRWSSDASRNITGLSISQGGGDLVEVHNVGAQNIVLKHQDTGSTAANRFICTGAADITLGADEAALFRYDGTTQRWRVRKI